MIRRGQAWVTQFRRVAKVSEGMAAQHIRQLYKSKAIPRMLYGLLPMPLEIKRQRQRDAARLCTLPDTHPLFQQLQRAARYPRLTRHISPLHNLLHEFGLKPNRMETRKPVRFDAQWDPGLTTCIWTDEDTTVEACENDTADLQFFTDGSGYKGGIGASAVMYWDGEEMDVLRYRLGDTLHHEVYEGECVGLILALHMLSEQDDVRKVSIWVDSTAAIQPTTLHHIFGIIPPVPRRDDDDDQ
ncbi:hypothetical protein K435DRAFT_812178 [Dendrothele bispora CBS 962.96]|uniref:RNase H type-1 domain-containing protein n=1 Tax=Dendrothele bispora (strain CBS 962.96) TaxID=1314807 RepID=A0A4S8KPW0_DENBC|nr:hypothetical protein K435DRAFT_812178 [Dendrothele bispora CBS 962.96]